MRLRPRAKAALDILADLCGLLFFGLLLWQGINEAQFSLQIGESTDGLIRFPLYPARITLALGPALFIVRLALDVVVDARHLIDGTEAEVAIRSEERRGGKGGVSTWRSRWCAEH